MRILREADPPAAGGGATPPADPVADPTAADVAAKGKTPREIALEKRISIVEDSNNTLSGQLKVFMAAAEAKDKKPPGATTPAVLLDEVNEYLGFGVS